MQIKKLISIIISAIMVLSVTVAMCACSPREKGFYDLYDEYENGNITLQETRKIAKYFSLQTGVYVEERVRIEKQYELKFQMGSTDNYIEIKPDKGMKVPELSEKKISEIKEQIYQKWEKDFIDAMKENKNEGESKEEQIEKYLEYEYCGKYHGKYAFAINIKSWIFNCSGTRIITSDLVYYSTTCDRGFYLYY